MGAARTTAAPRTVKLKGKKYLISPLRDRDYGEFEAWVQDQVFDVAKRNLDGLNDTDRQELLKLAYNKASSITISSPESLRYMTSVDGAVKLLWLSLRREHSDLTEDDVADMLTDPETLETAMKAIEKSEKLGGGRKGAKGPPRPRKVKRKKR